MPASRATASIETAWKPRSATSALVASSSCSRRSLGAHPCGWRASCHARYVTVPVSYGYRNAPPWTTTSTSRIVGSGFSGLGMAIRLKREGMDDFVVLERGDDVGGTWWVNTYPGLRLRRAVAPLLVLVRAQPGLDADLLAAAGDPRLPAPRRRRLRRPPAHPARHARSSARRGTRTAPLGARDLAGHAARARARRRHGAADRAEDARHPRARALRGRVFHSARWDHDYDLDRQARRRRSARAPRRSSSCRRSQPQVDAAARLPAHAAVGHAAHRPADPRLRAPALPAAARRCSGSCAAASTPAASCSCSGSSSSPRLMKVARADRARAHGAARSPTPSCVEKVTPDYTIGCKRILPSNTLVSGARPAQRRARHRRHRARCASTRSSPRDGEEREVDAIIFGTGFHVTDMPGRRAASAAATARTLDELWQGSPRAHLGTTVPGFPNLFLLLGPNTGLGHSSMVYMIESQVAHVLGALRAMRRARRADDRGPARGAGSATTPTLDAQLEGTVWSTGCASWYLDAHGPQRDAVARLDVAVPPPRGAVRPGGVRSSTRPSGEPVPA